MKIKVSLFLFLSFLGRSQNVTTVAGSVFGFSDGNQKTARFGGPNSLYISSDFIYIIEADGANAVRKLDINKKHISTIAGDASVGFINGKGKLARFFHPTSCTVDEIGNIYVADFNNHAIRKIDPECNVTTFAGGNDSGYVDGPIAIAKFNSPAGILYHNNYLYVTDFHNDVIRRISLLTKEVTTIAGKKGGGLKNGPALEALFSGPYGLCIDKTGNIFVSERRNHTIRKINAKGVVSTFAGTTQGKADGISQTSQFNMPVGMDIDSSSNIYVADMLNNCIRKIDRQGYVSTLAGSDVGFKDGVDLDVRFNHPTDVKIGPDGCLFVSDYGNYCIRKISFETTIWSEWWFRILELFLLMIIIIFIIIIIYNRKLKTERENNKRLIQNYNLEIKAIKAQMNPHFIFNSLNSIQKFILSNDNENAFKYLSVFSKLVRKLLESNSQENITVESETELLNNYLEMESLRFKHSFEYSIEVDKDLTPSNIMIPHMLIQPIVENAVWHGLLHKKGNRLLKIRFSFLDDKRLICTVEDNGIGRMNSKKNEVTDKKPLALDFIKQRLGLMVKTLGVECGLNIIDSIDVNGENQGTKVEITMPYFK